MKTLAEIVTALTDIQKEARIRINAALQGLPPLESMELAEPAARALNEMDYLKSAVAEIGQHVSELVAVAESEKTAMRAEVEKEVAAALVKEGKHVVKEDHEAMLLDARKEERETVEGEYRKAAEMRAAAETQRAAVEGDVGKVAASLFSVEDLTADDAPAKIAQMKDRVGRLQGLGMTEDQAAYKALASLPLTKEGDEDFAARFAQFEEFRKQNPARKVAASSPGGAPGGVPPLQSGGGGKKEEAAVLVI